MSVRGGHSGRNVRKTREAIVTTFNGLVLNGRYAEIGVRELVRRAGVGRSTFYQHFDDKTALLVESMYPLLSVLADAVSRNPAPTLPWVLAHFEEQRENALAFLQGVAERAAIELSLAKLVAGQVPRSGTALPRDDVAAAIARMTTGLIADWLAADPRIDRNEFAAVLTRTGLACRSALVSGA